MVQAKLERERLKFSIEFSKHQFLVIVVTMQINVVRHNSVMKSQYYNE